MSIASEITRLQGAKEDIKTAIEAKGVTVPANALLDSFDTYIAQISGGSTGLEYEEGTYIPTQNKTNPIISFTNQHTVPPAFIALWDTNQTAVDTNSVLFYYFIDVYRLFGVGFIRADENLEYAMVYWCTRSSSVMQNSYNTPIHNSDDPGSSDSSYTRYFATPSNFRAYATSSKYYRTNRTYKWVAIWK